MKPVYVTLICICFTLFSGCRKKDDAAAPSSGRKELVAGTWKQKDLVIAVSVKLGGQNIPAGKSMMVLAPMLGPGGALITCTKTNTYTFSSDNKMKVSGCTELLFPVTGNEGTWSLDIYDAVLLLKSAEGKPDPHWIDELTANSLKISITAVIPNVATVPLTLILEKT